MSTSASARLRNTCYKNQTGILFHNKCCKCPSIASSNKYPRRSMRPNPFAVASRHNQPDVPREIDEILESVRDSMEPETIRGQIWEGFRFSVETMLDHDHGAVCGLGDGTRDSDVRQGPFPACPGNMVSQKVIIPRCKSSVRFTSIPSSPCTYKMIGPPRENPSSYSE